MLRAAAATLRCVKVPPTLRASAPAVAVLARMPPARVQQVRFMAATPAKTEQETALETKLMEAFDTTVVNVEDISGGCGAQFMVECTSAKFAGMNTMKQHRLVNSILKEDIANMHAIRIFTKAE